MISSFYSKESKIDKIQKTLVDKDKDTDTDMVEPIDNDIEVGNIGGKKSIHKPEEDIVEREWTVDELTYIKNVVPTLEEHQRLQILHFMNMDGVGHTTMNDGLMVNLTSAPKQFLSRLYAFIVQSEHDKQYRDMDI
jgi:hypothetical protein